MDWKSIFARNGFLWQVFFYGGIIVMGISVAPQEILDTFPKWVTDQLPTIRFLAFIASLVGGKFGMSPAPYYPNGGNK